MEINPAPGDWHRSWHHNNLGLIIEKEKIRFKNKEERKCAEALDKMGIAWVYEPLIVLPKDKELKSSKKNGRYHNELRADYVFLKPYVFLNENGEIVCIYGFELKATREDSHTKKKRRYLHKHFGIKIEVFFHEQLTYWLGNGGIPLRSFV